MQLSVTQMGVSQTNHSIKKIAGLTLIEVLIALAIVSIAMTAVIKAASQNIRSTGYLQDKSMAMWVGQTVLNEARVNVLRLPFAPGQLKESTTMLGRDWHWQATKERTPNKNICKIIVSVYAHSPDDEDVTPLITLDSYVYQTPEFERSGEGG